MILLVLQAELGESNARAHIDSTMHISPTTITINQIFSEIKFSLIS